MLNTVNFTGKKLLPLYPAGTAPTPRMPIKLVDGTYKAGQCVEETGTAGTFQALAATDNTTKASHMLEYDVFVSGGQHYMGAQAYDESGGSIHTSAYVPGGALSFDTRDLFADNAGNPITAAIVAKMGGVVISGTAAAGIIQF